MYHIKNWKNCEKSTEIRSRVRYTRVFNFQEDSRTVGSHFKRSVMKSITVCHTFISSEHDRDTAGHGSVDQSEPEC